MSTMFSSPNALVYIRRNGLIVAGKHITPVRLSFPQDMVKNLEVPKPETLIDHAAQFFEANNLHNQRILMVLDQEIVFEKTIPYDKSAKPEALTQAFVDAIPLEAGKRAYVTLTGDQKLRIFATNKDLYEPVAQALHAIGIAKLIAITPAAAYNLEPGQQLSAIVAKLIRDTAVRKQADFSHTLTV